MNTQLKIGDSVKISNKVYSILDIQGLTLYLSENIKLYINRYGRWVQSTLEHLSLDILFNPQLDDVDLTETPILTSNPSIPTSPNEIIKNGDLYSLSQVHANFAVQTQNIETLNWLEEHGILPEPTSSTYIQGLNNKGLEDWLLKRNLLIDNRVTKNKPNKRLMIVKWGDYFLEKSMNLLLEELDEEFACIGSRNPQTNKIIKLTSQQIQFCQNWGIPIRQQL